MKVLIVVGTRPEAIKMAPVMKRLAATEGVSVEMCATAQHREMLDQVLETFAIKPAYDLDLMSKGQGLTDITCRVLTMIEPVLEQAKPDCVLVHGDTTTTMATALAAFYKRIPIGHVEAGLRSGDMYQPWPEEANRCLADVLTSLFFAPTETSAANLYREGKPRDDVFITGNTVIDALFDALDMIDRDADLTAQFEQRFSFLDRGKRLVVLTGHRRENFGEPFRNVCQAIARIADEHDVEVVYPVHLNPNVRAPVFEILQNNPRVKLIEPLDYLPFIYLMRRAHVIMTDSGGIQEEAPSLGKPVFVMRDVTERPEAVAAGTVELVGTDADRIAGAVGSVLVDQEKYARMSQAINPYGDGKASERIADVLVARFGTERA